MTRFRLTIEYVGHGLMGWQRQPHGPSVQEAIERAIAAVTGETVVVHAAGRTDAGVHADEMTAHCDIARAITPFRLMEAINAHLRDVRVAIIDCTEAAPDFHARFSARARHYVYHIVNRRAPLTFSAGLAWRIAAPLDAHAMHDAAQLLVGTHDFTTFRAIHCQASSPVRTLDKMTVVDCDDRIMIYASARSFLHHQVRSMTGCLVLVGRGKWSSADLAAALAARDRRALGLNAPPDGLHFLRADY